MRQSAALALVLASCTVHGFVDAQVPEEGSAPRNDASPPERNLPSEAKPKTVVRLSLDETVRILLGNNFQMRAAEVGRDIARETSVVERAVFDPFFTLSGDLAKNRQPTASFLEAGTAGLSPVVQVNPTETGTFAAGIGGRTVIGTTYEMTLSGTRIDRPLATGSVFGFNPQEEVNTRIQFSQPLLRGAWYDYNTSRIRIAANNKRLARHQLRETITELIYRAEVAYWELSFAIKNFESKGTALDTARQNVEKTRAEKDAGTRSDLELVVSESQLALRKVEHSEATTLLADARDRLLLLINRNGESSLRESWQRGEKSARFERLDVTPTTEPRPRIEIPERDHSLETAFRQRADYHQLAVRIENKTIELDIAENEVLPELNVTGSWTQHGLAANAGDSFDSLLTKDFYSWAAGLELRVPILMRGPRANRNRVNNELRQMKLQESDLENLVVVEVDKAIRDLRELFVRRRNIDERVRLQADLLAKEREKLRLGRSIVYNVSVIENDLVESQAQALRVAADYQMALSDYLRATGQMMDTWGVALEGD